MTRFVGLLRAVNVGGTGKLPMSDLKALCEAAGFADVRTYIASGNVVFDSGLTEPEVKRVLESALEAYAGKPVGVMIRTGAELTRIVAANPFAEGAANRVVAIFLDEPPPVDALEKAVGQAEDEKTALGEREIYVWYGQGMANTKLRIPDAKRGTARNLNTVAKLAEMAGG
jgi:uncharacterized protein (DUF1697 family)